VLKNNGWISNKHNKKNEQAQNMVKKMYSWKRMPMYTNERIRFNWRYLVWLRICLNKI